MENFFGTLKTEWLYRAHFSPKVEVEQLVADYVNFYNFERISLKTASHLLKSGAKPGKLFLIYNRFFFSLSVLRETVQCFVEKGGAIIECRQHGGKDIREPKTLRLPLELIDRLRRQAQ